MKLGSPHGQKEPPTPASNRGTKYNGSSRSVNGFRQFFKQLVSVEQCLTDKQWQRLERYCRWRPSPTGRATL
jgi:hypothetical protein